MALDRRRGDRGWRWIGGGGIEGVAGSEEADRGWAGSEAGAQRVGLDHRRGDRGRAGC